ncbi:hypothetical protein ACKKBG_A01835 [Auxenochlorella protothecoides x Auxenochlorella symbiontica]
MSMLDHINGKWHQRALGMTMRVEASTKEQVKNRIEMAKARQKGSGEQGAYVPDGFSLQALEAPSEPGNGDGSEVSDEDEAAAQDDAIDPELAAMMGFGGFGSSKA